MILLHYTGMPGAEGALSWLCDPRSAVSCHYFVHEDGRIVRLVDEARRAWHAGRAYWAGESDINARSIGIEIVNPGHEFGYRDFPPAQIEAVIALCRDIVARRRIPPERVLAHSDVAPERKQDPGERFPWDRLAEAGIGHFVPPEPAGPPPERDALGVNDYGGAVRRLQDALTAYGYRTGAPGLYDWTTELAVTAFQRHFRPARVDGRADASTVATLESLAAALAARRGRDPALRPPDGRRNRATGST